MQTCVSNPRVAQEAQPLCAGALQGQRAVPAVRNALRQPPAPGLCYSAALCPLQCCLRGHGVKVSCFTKIGCGNEIPVSVTLEENVQLSL